MGLRAAVIGGSGFGRYHAQWYAREGADVVAYLCRSGKSVETAEGPISELTRQHPCGYTDLDLLLRTERPEAVSICTPPAHHADPAGAALDAGAHVLCEKPIVYEAGRSAPEILAMADRMIDAAERNGQVLAVNLQYAAALEPYLRLYESARGPLTTPESYEFTMESKGNRTGPFHGEAIWIDLGPHALTPLMKHLPDAVPDESSIRTRASETEIVVEIDFVTPGGCRIHARLRTAACPKDAVPARRFGFNGFLTDIVGRRDESGLPRTGLVAPDGNAEEAVDDLMRTGIRRFLKAIRGEAEPLVTGREARANMRVVLHALERIRRSEGLPVVSDEYPPG